MKKIFMIAAAVAGMFAAASCQKEAPQSGVNGETANVTLSVQTPAVQTRTISDGKKANIVHWAAFDNNDKPVAGLAGTAVINGMKAEIEVTLVKHYDYNFVFWAHVGDEYGQNAAYGLSTFNEDGKVVVNYGGNANDENRDAFYANQIITIVSDNEVKEVKLYRPFAQINFLAADYKAIEAVGLQNGMTSTVKIAGLPTVLNGLDGTVDALTGETDLAATAVPTDPAYYTVNGEEYAWYSMNYVLAAVEKDVFTSAVTGVFNHAKKSDIEIPVANVPYRRNYRTNIIGDFFTDHVTINLVVMERFNEPDYLVEAATAQDINAALKAGYDVVLNGDVVADAGKGGYSKAGLVQTNGGTIDGNGNTVDVEGANGTWDCAIYTTGGTIKNLTVSGAMRGIFTAGTSSDIIIDNVIFKDVIYTFNSDDGNKNYGVYISNSTMNGWTSFSNVHKEVVFTDCTFGEGSGYAFCRPYNATTFTGCEFAAGYKIDPRAAVVFENCTFAGVALTDANLAELVTSNVQNATVR